MPLPNRGTFLQTGTLTNQQAAEAHAAVRDCVAMNGTDWEAATPYIHPCRTRGSDGILYESVQSSTGQDPVLDLSNTYWVVKSYTKAESDNRYYTKDEVNNLYNMYYYTSPGTFVWNVPITGVYKITLAGAGGGGAGFTSASGASGLQALTNTSMTNVAIIGGILSPAYVSGGIGGPYDLTTGRNGSQQATIPTPTPSNGYVIPGGGGYGGRAAQENVSGYGEGVAGDGYSGGLLVLLQTLTAGNSHTIVVGPGGSGAGSSGSRGADGENGYVIIEKV